MDIQAKYGDKQQQDGFGEFEQILGVLVMYAPQVSTGNKARTVDKHQFRKGLLCQAEDLQKGS